MIKRCGDRTSQVLRGHTRQTTKADVCCRGGIRTKATKTHLQGSG